MLIRSKLRHISIAFILFTIFSFCGLSDSTLFSASAGTNPRDVENATSQKIILDSVVLNMKPGDSREITITSPSKESLKAVWWYSSDENMGEIVKTKEINKAIVTTWNPGTFSIIVGADVSGTDESLHSSCEIRTTSYPDAYAVRGVRVVGGNERNVSKGSAIKLEAKTVPDTAINKSVSWRILEGDRIVSVSSTGYVEGLSKGSAVVQAVSSEGGFAASAHIEVFDSYVPVKSVSLNHASLSVYVNETKRLEARINPENASNKKVSWLSANRDIASVSQTGVVSGHSRGRTIVSVITEDGNHVGECEITVRDGWLDIGPMVGCSISDFGIDGNRIGLIALLFPLLFLKKTTQSNKKQ